MAPSRGARRAPAGPARARSARRSGAAAAWPTAPSPAATAQRTPKKMVRLALHSALSDRAADGRVLVVDEWGFDGPAPRTPSSALGLRNGVEGRVLGRAAPDDEAVWKSFRNLAQVHICCAGELNAYDVLVTDWVVFFADTLPRRPTPGRGSHADGGAM